MKYFGELRRSEKCFEGSQGGEGMFLDILPKENVLILTAWLCNGGGGLSRFQGGAAILLYAFAIDHNSPKNSCGSYGKSGWLVV